MRMINVVLMSLLVSIPASAGVVFDVVATDTRSSKTFDTEVLVEGDNLKMAIAPGTREGRNGEMIYQGAQRSMILVNHEEKTFMTIDEEAIKAITSQLGQAMSQMEHALKDVPEEQRAMVEKMMKGKLPTATPKRQASELRSTGERATHNGYPCVKYEVLRGGTKLRELWVTDWSNIEGGKEVVASFEQMAEFFKELLDSIPNVGDQAAFAEPTWEHMKELGGFPVVTRDFAADGTLGNEAELRSARRQKIEPGAFEAPAGYARREMFSTR